MKRYIGYLVLIASLAFIVNGCTSKKSNPVAPQATFSVTGLSATRTDSVTVQLTWNAVGGADTLYVKRGWGSNPTPSDTISRLSGAATSWTDSGLRSDSSYSYQVVAHHDTATTASSVVVVARYTVVPIIHYSVTIRPILNICANCHNSSLVSGGWTVDGLTAAVVNRTVGSYHGLSGIIVVPGNPSASEMYQKIVPTSNDPMPQGGPPLSSAQIQTIFNWIQQGANP